MSPAFAPLRLKSLFLSDLHLGARAARPKAALEFLAAHEAETIYLVGDIFDIWHGGRIHWPREAEELLAELDRRAATGTRVIYLCGNHDAKLRSPEARLPAGMTAPRHWQRHEVLTHEAADGRRYLVLHGDQCDSRLMRQHFMTRIGSRADAFLRGLDDWLGRRLTPPAPGRPSRIERAISTFNSLFVMGGRFEARLVALARSAKADGVICGHSHKPMLRSIGGTLYANCGDWVDSFTALIETHEGALRLVEWARPPHATRPKTSFGPLAQDA
ncbi:UDP-2,3-diacylglucosamine diphosphatase [Pseudodonghicola flavimaris]|uniref:UDP-2,3-diacylglucosamine diphosphatase n=1 Tax=Pseudodonghicola flavimaris TaxID=3050036 RepID=A0ABT7F1D8_9RHOB|nr:UDP-2,3-diacylglucosamine diphosphatase [Pseudodonghicola flavimaris]MDK3018421.1 UDP-2,3-diacylglucosamine diphosphatase [Pseudodonghicola flavimaris]